MCRDRVKYYSAADWSCGHNLLKIEGILDNFDDNYVYDEINQIIEFYNIQCFFKNNVYLQQWSEKVKNNYINKVTLFSKHIGKYLSKINESNIEEILDDVEISYKEEFWELFSFYKVYKRITVEGFKRVLEREDISIYYILRNKEVVKFYDNEIRNFLLEGYDSAELLLDQYAKLETYDCKPVYFPDTLTHKDKEEILLKYIDSEYANSNYIKLILESQSSSELMISPIVKLKAKYKYDEEMNKLFKDGNGFSYGAGVCFVDDQEEEAKFEMKDKEISISYSSNWIKENNDYATLLNNFIYLFEYVDYQFRSIHVNKLANLSTLEKTLGVKGVKEYITGIVFNQIQCMAMVQTIAYYQELKKNNIRLETILEWFFKDYLRDEFGVVDFELQLPSEHSTYLEKCRTISSEIDSILKQFRLYVENGEINQDLVQLTTGHVFIKDIPSLIVNKYIYPLGREYNKVSHLLFSDQTLIKYIEGKKECRNFYKLLFKDNIRITDFEDFQLSDVNWMLEKGYVYEDDNNRMRVNKATGWLLNEFYYNEVIASYYVKDLNESIEEMKNKGMVEFKSSLFTKPEQDYFNYIMNQSEFSNGLDLRNRYIHGTQSRDVKQHEHDYFIFLRVLVLIVIKINEELCIAQDEKILKTSREQ